MPRNTGRGSPQTNPRTAVTNPRARTWIKGRAVEGSHDDRRLRWWVRLLRR